MDKNRDIPSANDTRSVCIMHSSQSTTSDIAQEHTLPDYYPEVKKVISTICRVLPESRYDNGEAVEQRGVCAFTVIYLGDDGTVAAVPVSADYSVSLPYPSEARCDKMRITADTTADGVSCRATAPRKLMLRAKLHTRVTVISPLSTDVTVSCEGGEVTAEEKINLEERLSDAVSMDRGWGCVTGSINGELHERSGTQLIMCDGEIIVNEVGIVPTGIRVRGEAVMWCICYSPDKMYYKTSAKMPIEETIATDTPPIDGAVCRAWGRAASVSVKESEDGTFLWDVEYDIEAEWCAALKSSLVCDMYSTMHPSEAEVCECEFIAPVKCGSGRLSISDSQMRHSPPRTGEYVIATYGNVKNEHIEANAAKLSLIADAEIHVLICGGGEVEDEVVKVPVKYEFTPDKAYSGELSWRICASIAESGASTDAESVRVSAEVIFTFEVCEKARAKYVSALALDRSDEDAGDSCGVIRIIYPDRGEDRWDIAKRYRIRKSDIGELTDSGIIIG